MKRLFLLLASALMAASLSAQSIASIERELAPLLPSASQVDSASYLLGTNIGQWIKSNDFGQLNYDQLLKGLHDMVGAKGKPDDENYPGQFRIDPQEIDNVMTRFMERRSGYVSAFNKKRGEAFLLANKKKTGVQVSESGLQYKILKPGKDGRLIRDNDTVFVNYKGMLIDGSVFDQSGDEPAQFTINQIIKGFGEGIKLIGVGGKGIVYIPSELGYGEQDNRRYGSPIGPNETLIFEIEVVKRQQVPQHWK